MPEKEFFFPNRDGLLVRFNFLPILVLTFVCFFPSCGGDKEKATQTPTSISEKAVSKSVEKAPEEEIGIAVPPLSKYTLERYGKSCALVRIPGEPDRQGILLRGASNSARSYLMLCEVPEGIDSVFLSYMTSQGIGKSNAKRISRLPSGLSVFGFTAATSLQVCRLEEPLPGETFHAIRVEADGVITDEEMASIDKKREEVRTKIEEIRDKQRERMRPAARYQNRRDPRLRGDPRQMQMERHSRMEEFSLASRELAELKVEEEQLLVDRQMPISTMKAVELAAVSGLDEPFGNGTGVESSLLATKSKGVVAIRSQGMWLSLKEVVAESGNIIDSVELTLNGSQNRINFLLKLFPVMPSAESAYVLVAETTFGLESKGSGSIEDRLSRVDPLPLQGSGSGLSVSKNLEWSGQRTKLWVKVFDPAEPDNLVLDEVILLDYPGSFSARWGKEPSPLISIASPEPNQPENLVRERKSLDAKGKILDLVAAGDGSVIMVRTDREPYWVPLDLKTGKWSSVPWKATANTLIATQAGKVHLIDKESMVMETWGLTSGKREDLQILPIPEEIVAVATPLTNTTQPMLVASAKGAYFLDAVDFEVISCGLDADYLFEGGTQQRNQKSPLNPATISVRASDDGALYSLFGKRTGEEDRSSQFLTVTVDSSPMVVRKSTRSEFLGSQGRHTGQYLVDHGGTGMTLTASSSGARFPVSTGEIRITDNNRRTTVATFENPPVLPDLSPRGITSLAPDRCVYLDSTNEVMLLPDGDTLHLIRINLPEVEKATPAFLLAGESLEIPLPLGTGHKLISKDGGESEVTDTCIRWTAPDSNREVTHRLKLEWTGELGSAIDSDHQVRVLQSASGVEVESPDGSLKVQLSRRGIIKDLNTGIKDFAGSGFIALHGSGDLTAWNLWTCEKIFHSDENCRSFFGDADRMYSVGHDGKLTSYDILTGEKLAEAALGKDVRSIATGMSSRESLLAVEQNGGSNFLLQIARDTLKPQILEMPQQIQQRLFAPQLATNASGSAAWTRGVGIFRDGRAVTVEYFPHEQAGGVSSGIPDNSGQLVVEQNKILNLAEKPLSMREVSAPEGMESSTTYKLDESGRYLLLGGYEDNSMTQMVSVRKVSEPENELFKIRYPSRYRGQLPLVISSSKTLVSWQAYAGSNMAVVYDFDIPQIVEQLSR